MKTTELYAEETDTRVTVVGRETKIEIVVNLSDGSKHTIILQGQCVRHTVWAIAHRGFKAGCIEEGEIE